MILELTGPGRLTEAAEALLYSEDIQLAVIRGAGSSAMLTASSWPDAINAPASFLERHLAGLSGLEAAAVKWAGENLPTYCTVRPFDGGTASGPISVHTDLTSLYREDALEGGVQAFEGPLTFSYRALDQSEAHSLEPLLERRFYVRRTAQPLLTAHGFDFDSQERLYRYTKQRHYAVNPTEGMTSVVQRPNDLVLFVNYPRPSLHAVTEVQQGSYPVHTRTRAILGRWSIIADLPPNSTLTE